MTQIWTSPRADLNTIAGGNALAYGVAGGLTNLGQSIERAMEAKKNRNATAKYFLGIVKASPTLQQSMGMDYEDLAALSSDDIIAKSSGAITANTMERQRREAELHESLQQRQLAEYDRHQREAEASAGLAESILGPAEAGIPSPVSNENFDAQVSQRTGMAPVGVNILRAYQRAGVAPPTAVVDQLMQSAMKGGNWDPSAVIDLPGAPGYKKTQTSAGQFQVIPPRELPGDKEPTIRIGVGEPNLLGQYPNTVTVTPSQYKKHKAALDELGFKVQPIGGQPALGDVLPLPKDKSQLVKGKKYQTSRGVATWNGAAFEQ